MFDKVDRLNIKQRKSNSFTYISNNQLEYLKGKKLTFLITLANQKYTEKNITGSHFIQYDENQKNLFEIYKIRNKQTCEHIFLEEEPKVCDYANSL